jgi:branched-chain amino acid transport system ATP-binding protein
VRENLMVGAYTRSNRQEIEKAMYEVFELFPRLKERINQRGGTLSGGEQQMLAVGRALMSQPQLLMLDEPSLGLAPIVIDVMFETIVRLNREMGLTILLVEQNASLALDMCNRAYVLKTGKITMEGKGKDLLEDPRVRATYLGIK